MPIYTNDPCDDGCFPTGSSLRSSIGIGPKVTKAIDAATKDWLDKHPEATTTVEDDSLTNAKFMDGSVNSRVIENGSITTDDIDDLAVTTPKIADNAITADKIATSAADGLRTMSTTQPGVAKVGAGLAMDNNGALELNGGNIAPAVTAWLDAHPEATTTVQDGSVTDAKLAQNGVKSVVGDIDSELTDGIFIPYANGSEVQIQTYSCTDYIPCIGMKIYVKTETANDSSGIVFYDGAKNYISGFNPYSHNYTLFELEIPDTAVYVRISCLIRYKASFVVERRDFVNQTAICIGNIESDASAQSEAILKLNNIKDNSRNILPINGKSVTFAGVTISYNDGVIIYSGTATGSGGRTSKLINPITLPAGTYTLWAENGVSQIFIENTIGDTIITNIGAGNAWKSTFTLESETTLYIGSNVENGIIYNDINVNVMLESGSRKTEYEAPSYATAIDHLARSGLKALDRFWAYAMWKILCIGDSLTSGACWSGAWSGASIDQNYPRILGRMLDAETTNAGVSGLTASQWYNNEISKYNLANFDTFIIWLGTNGGLTDTLDTDVDPYSDYSDFANTNTGNYCKIIEKIKADNPDCLIILTKVFVSDATNAVIDKIAMKYELPVVDNSDLTVANYPELHGNINNPHFTKPGNLVIANRYVTTLADIFANNPTLANYGLTARAN